MAGSIREGKIRMNYDQWLAGLCIWREARGASLAAQTGVWWVLQNRASDAKNRWPKTLGDVVVQPFQFSSFNKGDPNASAWPSPKKLADWGAWLQVQEVVGNVLGGDSTSGANHYHSTPEAEKEKWPNWAQDDKLTVVIGPFRFYRL